jgi:hypothetical protein
MVQATIGGSFCFAQAISMFTYSVLIRKLYHLPNKQQQDCMDSLLVTGRAVNCLNTMMPGQLAPIRASQKKQEKKKLQLRALSLSQIQGAE